MKNIHKFLTDKDQCQDEQPGIFNLSVFIQLSLNGLQLHLYGALCLLQLCIQLVLQIQPELLTALSRQL